MSSQHPHPALDPWLAGGWQYLRGFWGANSLNLAPEWAGGRQGHWGIQEVGETSAKWLLPWSVTLGKGLGHDAPP